MTRSERVGRTAPDCIAAVARLQKPGALPHIRQDSKSNSERQWILFVSSLSSLRWNCRMGCAPTKWNAAVHTHRRAWGKRVGTTPYGVIFVDGKAVPFEPRHGSFVRYSSSRSNGGATHPLGAVGPSERATKALAMVPTSRAVGPARRSRAF